MPPPSPRPAAALRRSAAPVAAALAVLGLALGLAAQAQAQDAAATWRTPPPPVPRILDAPPPPVPSLSPDRGVLLFIEREGLPPLERLAAPELRLAGLRFHPDSRSRSRQTYGLGFTLVSIATGERTPVDLPGELRIGHGGWSPDGASYAFTHTGPEGVELWVLRRETGEVSRLTGPVLNAVLAGPWEWDADSGSLYVRRIPRDLGPPPEAPAVPPGPLVQESAGAAEPVRTWQDLIGGAHDEALFEHYLLSEWVRVDLSGEEVETVLPAAIWGGLQVSPDGSHLLATRYKRPFSRQAPLFAFARQVAVFDRAGAEVRRIEDRVEPVLPPIGRDMVLPGPREVHWRSDAPAALVWTEAADRGDARAPATVRDRVLMLPAPFAGGAEVLIELDQRFAAAVWGRDDAALIRTAWRTDSRTRTYLVSPAEPGREQLLFDRSLEDRYTDPGTPLTEPAGAGHRVLVFDESGEGIFLSGEGASPEGSRPFLDRLDLATGGTERLWQSADPHYESALALLDREGRALLTRRESADEPPNLHVRDLGDGSLRALTDFPDPAPELAGMQREILTYRRNDGIPLSATLLTPPGYDAARDGPLPALLWAYPREFRDASAAGQVADSPHRFSRPSGASHLFLLTQGYAIIDGPAMPIIGEGETEPNDTYVEQLVASASAAVDEAVARGVARRGRIAVGGHSYGAFMAANLLAHSGLFRAGVARSGAYNRTLTPFGFQAEPRSYWEAPEVYLRMSPFMHADRISAPVLFLHGAEDDNAGTYSMQSERMHHAVAGLGGTSRLVMLPHESHGFQARESVHHVLAEMIAWLERHLRDPGE